MSILSKISSAVGGFFASYSEVTSANQIETNPIAKSVENIDAKPKFKTVDGFEYLKFGTGDDVDLMLDKMIYKSTMHSGIITKKAKMITGKGISVNSELRGGKNEALQALLNHAGGANISLFHTITKAAFEYEKSGSFGVIVDFSAKRQGKNVPKQPIKFTVVPARHMRLSKPANIESGYTEMIYKKSFKPGADVPKAEKLPLFNPFDKSKRQLLYVKNPYSVLDSYGVPSHMAAFHYIETDYEFGVQLENSAKNGFAPKTHVTLIGRNMSEEARRASAEGIQGRLSSPTGDQTIVTFVAKKEEAPEIKSLDIQNLDKTIQVMAGLNDAKILTAHNVTSPSLFGVMASGNLGGGGTEMLTAYNIFKATETIPDRRTVVEAFEMLFEATELKGIEIEVIEEDVNVEFKTKPTEDGNKTKDVEDKKGDK